MVLHNYEILREVSRNSWHVLYKGRRLGDQRTVLLKMPTADPPTAADIDSFEEEYAILRDLEAPGVPRAHEIVRNGRQRCVVLEDVGTLPLANLPSWRRPDVDSVLTFSIQLSAILADLHRRQITHKNLNPRSIHVQPESGRAYLTDFSFASQSTDATRTLVPPYRLRGELAYMSPEQTGRMNRVIDYRTDFYSLGVILYELLVGALPFQSNDTLELIHWHIAKAPTAPREIDPRIPEPLSQIVLKLLSKTAEERYQSAIGLKADLETCAHARDAGLEIADFRPGRRDVWDQFVLPQRLYGREHELDTLQAVFDQICQGRSALVLVAGYSGIGKTSLIQELYKPLVRQRGYFTAGKFDQIARNIPFGALIQAFSGLLQHLLTEPDDRIALWRMRLAEAVGSGASVLAEVIPEIELLMGEQPAPAPLGPTETLNRFQLVLQNFVGALARHDHPLVVFLDDLQWADAATLSLLQPLLTSPDIQHLLVIGAYRDNEVDAGHPLARTVGVLESASVRIARIFLGPLRFADSCLLLRDAIHRPLDEVEPPARLVQEKTAGNPFFVIQFLKTLRQEGLLSFDYELGHWSFRMDAIANAGITDNVIDLMTRKIQRLSGKTQRTLTLAACIGGRFDAATMATISENPVEATTADLKEALNEGLILPAAHSVGVTTAAEAGEITPALPTYVFLHDRVQQAAYGLIPDSEKALMHLTVGRLLLDRWNRDQAPEKIFDIVGHLNIGSALIGNPAERLALARLNLEAGRKAKTSAAWDAASVYFDRGIALLSDDHWELVYELVFGLHLEAAECHYLARRFDIAEDYFGLLLTRALTPLDQAQVHALRIVLYENLSHYSDAVVSGREGLKLFGILLPDRAEDAQAALDAEIETIQGLLGERTIESLIDLSVMTDANIRMVMRILTSLWSPAYIAGNQLVARLISATMVRLSLAHGNTEDSAYGYVTHAITIGPMRGDYRSAYAWGELALRVNERFDDAKRRAKIHQQFHAHVNLWRRPFATCIPHAREACRSGLEAGDLNYAGYGAVTETWPALPITNDLGRFVRDYEPAVALLEKLRLTDFLAALRVMLNWALALQGRTAAPLSLSNADFDETAFIAKFENEPFFRTFFDTAKLHLCVLLEEIEAGLETARRARQGTLAGTIWPVLVDFWGGLALTGAFGTASEEERTEHWRQLVASQESLQSLADNCPENYRCFWLLLSAEMNRISSQYDEAAALCKEAITYARQTDNLQQEALANELCARALLACDAGSAAGAAFLMEAHRCYAAWGAAVKVQQMAEKYRQLLATRAATAIAERPDVPQWATGPQEALLDMSSVLKAAHAIAVEIQLDDLLKKLIQIALENAGAQRGVFLRDRDGRLIVEAEGTADEGSVLRREALEEVSHVSRGVVQYVRKTGRSVVLSDAAADERFAQDPYIASAHPRSILCMPAVHQGKLEGILYVENNLATDAFTADRIKVLDIICAQAAISLENARLYDEMKQEATQRRRAEEMLREVTEGTASSTGADFFPSLVKHLASALKVRYTFVAECRRDKTRTRARSRAFWTGNGFGDNFEFDVADTPCQKVLDGNVCYYGDDIQRLFPKDRDLAELNAKSYLGAPMFNAADEVIGHLAVLDDQPMHEDPWAVSVLRIFSARAGAELERLQAEEGLRAALTEVESLKNRLQDENVYLQEEIRHEHNFEEMVGSSPALLDTLRRVERVAPTEATVLIYGETGTGKELIARAIHSRSARKGRPLVKVNCGAISAGLVESELFGHLKGAFTGAIERRIGRFEVADRGTLFLDEVSELPLETQVKLLRVLQEQEFEPVGSSKSVRVNVRIIAATNRDLQEAVNTGRFRSDLFFRLNVFPIHVPLLRERSSDIPQLVTFFLTRLARQFGKRIEGVSPQTMALLMAYEWPGNIRELQNVVERAVVLADRPVLSLGPDLLPLTENNAVTAARNEAAESQSAAGAVSPTSPLSLAELERGHIQATLDQTRGVIEGPQGAAKILNLHPNTLRSRMKKLGVQRSGN